MAPENTIVYESRFYAPPRSVFYDGAALVMTAVCPVLAAGTVFLAFAAINGPRSENYADLALLVLGVPALIGQITLGVAAVVMWGRPGEWHRGAAVWILRIVLVISVTVSLVALIIGHVFAARPTL